MAIKYSQNDLNAIKAARAIRDYNNAAINLQNRAIANEAAKSKQSEGGLGGVLAGIGESIGNVGSALTSMFGRGAASVRDLITGNAGTGKYTKEFQQWEKENLHGDANMSDKDLYARTAGKALDAAATTSDFIPGLGAGARAALNIGQGAASGLAQEYIDNGANADFTNALKRAGVGAAASGVGQAVAGKLAARTPGNGRISKLLNSNVGRGAITGATAGAVGGGLATGLGGGSLEEVLSGALQGAQSGAIGGGAMSGLMGIAGSGIDKLNNKIVAPEARNVVNELPESTITKQAIEVETPTRRGIAVTDYDAGEQRVNVRRPNAPTNEYSLGKNAGSTLDGILGPNNPRKLPNAATPTDADLLKKWSGGDYENATAMIANEPDMLNELKNMSPDLYNRVREGAKDYAELNRLSFDGTQAANKSDLPLLNRQQYYEDTIGKVGRTSGLTGNKYASYEDVPDYMRNHLKNDNFGEVNGVKRANDDILREFFNDDTADLGELYRRYEELAQAPNANEIYTSDNIVGGARLNNLGNELDATLARGLGLRNQLEVGGDPSLRQNIDVELLDTPSNETVYTKRTLAPKVQAQEQNLPAVRQQTLPASQEEVPLIQKGTPEYEAIKQQEYIDNRRRELRNTVTEGIRSQYGTIRLGDRINGLDDAIMELAGYGLTKRSQIDGFSNRITGKNGEMSKAIRRAMNESGKTDGRIDITMDDVYRASGASGNKAAMDKIESRFNSIGKKYTVDADGSMNRSDMYDFGRELEREGYRMIEYAGRSKDALGVDSALGEAMRMLGENYIAKATDGVDMGKYINANKLKNLLPGNEAWAAHVDQTIPNIKTVSDARSFMAAPTKLSLLADAVEYNKGTYGSNVGNAALAKDGTQAIRAVTSANPMRAGAQYVAAKTLDSNVLKDKVVKNALKKYNNIEAGGTGNAGITGKLGGIGSRIGKMGQTLNNDTVNGSILGDILNRQTTRQIGLGEASNMGARKELQGTQAALDEATAEYQNAANSYQQAKALTESQQASRGAQQLQSISEAMDRALAAGDMKAYGQLADLYKEAYNIYGKQAEPKALTANQSKALTGLQQVEQLSQMSPDMGTALANSPLGFLVNMTGGNEYANQAQSLALTLGYLQSGANITPREAENIGKSYVPTAYDSEEVRQQKLARARQLLNNYLGDTSALQS
jgi:hypothetical protein